MTNLTKEQLLEKDEAGLQDIAQQLNVKDIEGKSKENLIYDILDAQAEQTADNETPVKRRTRIVKRNEADHIFSTNLTPAKSAESDAEEAASAKKQTSEKADIFDIISKTFLSKGIAGKGQIPIPPKGAVVVYELPVGTILKYDDGKIIADGKYTILN
mgnify:CR=1 FL=1